MRFNTIFDNMIVTYFFGPPCIYLLAPNIVGALF